MLTAVKDFVRSANFGWLDTIAVLAIGSALMWLTNRVTGHVCECDANEWRIIMFEVLIAAAIAAAAYYGYRWYKKNEADFNKNMDDMSE